MSGINKISKIIFILISWRGELAMSFGGSSNMNCNLARKQCLADPRCGEAMAIFKKVCGPELAACTTATKPKCRRVLRTLQGYDILLNCRCGDPKRDYQCHAFRSTIFSNPCDTMDPSEKESLMVLATCEAAVKSCRSDTGGCFRIYTNFIEECKFTSNGNFCRAQDREKCERAWEKIRHSEVFGCICPPEPASAASSPNYYDTSIYGRRVEDKIGVVRDISRTDADNVCMKVFNETHRNPCLKPDYPLRSPQIEEKQQTCHEALVSCQNDKQECKPLLNDVMMWCDHSHCEPDRCRSALVNFYASLGIRRRLEIAFCVCRQQDANGECLTAMRKLHPTCAQRQGGGDERKCHEITHYCRENPNCRSRLEDYEQNCSADAISHKCVSTHRSCQVAVTRILGTELHASCVCKGTDFLHQQDCYAWQKLLWSNPCVVESHLSLQDELRRGMNLDSHFTKAPEISTTTIPTVPSENYDPEYGEWDQTGGGPSAMGGIDGPMGGPDGSMGSNGGPGMGRPPYDHGMRGRIGGIGMKCPPENPLCRRRGNGVGWDGGRSRMDPNMGPPPDGPRVGIGIGGPRGQGRPRWRGEGGYRNPGSQLPPHENGRTHIGRGQNQGQGRFDSRDSYPTKFGAPREVDGDHYNGNRRRMNPNMRNANKYQRPLDPIGSSSESEHFENIDKNEPVQTTTEMITTTTLPPRYCVLQSSSGTESNEVENIRIPEGTWRRIYNKGGCSSLCECTKVTNDDFELQAARCNTLGCIQPKNCITSAAQYPHASPYYEAYRGECFCYYGKFICQRPDEADEYFLGPGIFLFLGYSRQEMELLKHQTSASELKALKEIEKMLVQQYGFQCKLVTKNHFGENLILVVELRLDQVEYLSATQKQNRAKEQCTGPLEKLVSKINTRPRLPEVIQDAYLSMFILAELHTNLPEAHTSLSAAAAQSLQPSHSFIILIILTFILIFVLSSTLTDCICADQEQQMELLNVRQRWNLFLKRIPAHVPFIPQKE